MILNVQSVEVQVLLTTYTPESWGRGEDWQAHATRLWREEGTYMAALRDRMVAADAWIGSPIAVDDSVVQDGHHRIVLAAGLGWHDREVPLIPAVPEEHHAWFEPSPEPFGVEAGAQLRAAETEE